MKVPRQTNINKLLRKASSSRDPSVLPALLQTHELTTSDLETPSSDGKNALHMACWMGCAENISLLLSLGCDINAISTGKHNYGKSPIFYAITRGREEVVRYLLNYESDVCNVRIVNNKGQSVYSLAYSHDFSGDILESIRKREAEGVSLMDGRDVAIAKDLQQWCDYSVSHSDGCIYGDLDLRFLSRPLTDEDVIKDDIVVNPTTKESRKGNFAKNNPSAADEPVITRKGASEKKRRQRKEQIKQLSTDQHLQLDQLWNAVSSSLQQNNSWDLFSSLLAIVQFWETLEVRLPWISDSATRLDFLIKFEAAKAELFCQIETIGEELTNMGIIRYDSLLFEATVFCGSGDRHAILVKRIISKTTDVASPQSNDQMQRHDSDALLNIHQERLDAAWTEIDAALIRKAPVEIYLSLIKPIILCDGRTGSNWMHDHSKRLHLMLESKSLHVTDDVVRKVLQLCEASSSRHASLLKRLLTRSTHNDFNESINSVPPATKSTASSKKNSSELPNRYKSFIKCLQSHENCSSGDLPSWNVLMNPYLPSKVDNQHLSLPNPPVFIDSSAELSRLEAKLHNVAAGSIQSGNTEEMNVQFNQLIAFDSEFYTADNGETEVATIQFSVLENGVPSAWVVDLLPRDGEYHLMACNVLHWLFLESNSHIIGFAPRHDLHLLSLYTGEDLAAASVWDVQLLAAHIMSNDGDAVKKNILASMPGLKLCSSYSLKGSSWSLSKEEQCSDWKQRPLSVTQLEYAGLDAGVLFVLLSELVRRRV